MIGPAYARTMARYNAWQNQWMFQAADGLTDTQRQEDRGGFFGGIQATLSHVMWGDTLWISRFDGGESVAPATSMTDTTSAYHWPALMARRPLLDARIAAWAWSADDNDFTGDFSWFSGAVGRDMTVARSVCIMQMFNHQTHHRGQVHAMLTGLGVKTCDTDLPFMPAEVPEWR